MVMHFLKQIQCTINMNVLYIFPLQILKMSFIKAGVKMLNILLILKMSFIKAEVKTLNIMGLLPMTGKAWPGGGACLTAAELALRHVNEREDILKEFKLNLTWRDSKVSDIRRGPLLKIFLKKRHFFYPRKV